MTPSTDYLCPSCGREAILHDANDFPCKLTESDVLREHLRKIQSERVVSLQHIYKETEQELSVARQPRKRLINAIRHWRELDRAWMFRGLQQICDERNAAKQSRARLVALLNDISEHLPEQPEGKTIYHGLRGRLKLLNYQNRFAYEMANTDAQVLEGVVKRAEQAEMKYDNLKASFVELYNAIREYKIKRYSHPLNDPTGKKYEAQAMRAEDDLFYVFDKYAVVDGTVENKFEKRAEQAERERNRAVEDLRKEELRANKLQSELDAAMARSGARVAGVEYWKNLANTYLDIFKRVNMVKRQWRKRALATEAELMDYQTRELYEIGYANGAETASKNLANIKSDMRVLVNALKQARIDIEGWADYASDYFREKHDLQGDLNAAQKVIDEYESKYYVGGEK